MRSSANDWWLGYALKKICITIRRNLTSVEKLRFLSSVDASRIYRLNLATVRGEYEIKGFAYSAFVIGDNWRINIKYGKASHTHTPSTLPQIAQDGMRQEDTSLDYYDKFVFPQCS